MSDPHLISITVNGVRHETVVEARRSLADVLRHDLGLTGTHIGCEHGICGTCTVLVEGKPTRSCLMFGVQADDLEVETVESLAENGELNGLPAGLRRRPRPALRLLHAGLPHACHRAVARESEPNRRRDPRRDVRQPVPLHRLRGDPGGRARRCRRLKPRRSTMATTSAPPTLDPKDVLGLRPPARRRGPPAARPPSATWSTTACCPRSPTGSRRASSPRELAKELGDARPARHAPRGLRLRRHQRRSPTALACLELEGGDSGLRSFVSVQGSLAMFPIWTFGSRGAEAASGCRGMAAGEAIGCFGLTEPDFGSDPAGMRTTRQARRRRLGPQRHQDVDHQRLASPTSRSCGRADRRRASAASSSRPTPPASPRRDIKQQALAARLGDLGARARRRAAARRDAMLPGVTRPARAALLPERGPLRHPLGRDRRGPRLLRDGARLRRRRACSSTSRSPASSSPSASSPT